MNKHRPQPGPKVRRGLVIFYIICALLVLLDLTGLRHGESDFDGWWGFYAVYGFIACAILVITATWLRKLIMRGEDYYRRHEDD